MQENRHFLKLEPLSMINEKIFYFQCKKAAQFKNCFFKFQFPFLKSRFLLLLCFFLSKFNSVMYSFPDIKIWPSVLNLDFQNVPIVLQQILVNPIMNVYQLLIQITNVTRDVTETPAKKSCRITKQLDEVLARCPLYEQRTLTLKLMTMELLTVEAVLALEA